MSVWFSTSDLKAKARRWDEKQVDGLKRKRDSFLTELKELSKHRRKEPELQNLRSQIDGLEHRLRYSTKDKETTVSWHFHVPSPCLTPISVDERIAKYSYLHPPRRYSELTFVY